MKLSAYRALGRSGLIVSPMALGTMTFGKARWGTDEQASRSILDAYVEGGGNFVDTAEAYADGRSEEILGAAVADRGWRDRLVIATKFSWNRDPGNPNGGGSGRKNIERALAGSLRRLQTDYIDLYWLHMWDQVTPVEDVLESLSGLVRSGRIRYYGLSNVPAWFAVKLSVLASERGLPGPIALQLQYSLVERALEAEYVPAARECGMAIVPWSPLGGGLLSGKYRRGGKGDTENDRLAGDNPFGDSKFDDRNWRIVDGLTAISEETGLKMTQLALAWLSSRAGVGSILVGASRIDQLRENVSALGVSLDAALIDRLEGLSRANPIFPSSVFNSEIRQRVFGGTGVTAWHELK